MCFLTIKKDRYSFKCERPSLRRRFGSNVNKSSSRMRKMESKLLFRPVGRCYNFQGIEQSWKLQADDYP